jgi:hypothetical protein
MTLSETQKRCINAYKESHRDEVLEYMRSYSRNKYNTDEEYRKEKIAKERERKRKIKDEAIANGVVFKPRGRPRKIKEPVVEQEIIMIE